MSHPVFIDGEPVLSGGRGQDSWQAMIRKRAGSVIVHPKLTFVVSALRRRGQYFDLDNLVHPVLMAFDDPIDCMSARLHVGDRPGLLIEDSAPDSPTGEIERRLYVQAHSRSSERERPGIPEIADDPVLDEHDGLGLSLAFDNDEVPIRRGWFGPTEAVIDDLSPWFGRYTKRRLIADHRLRDLRIARGVKPEADGVAIEVWYVPDQAVQTPSHVSARIAVADRYSPGGP